MKWYFFDILLNVLHPAVMLENTRLVWWSHIRILPHQTVPSTIFSRYHQHDLIVQAVVDDRKCFLDFASGFPGSMYYVRILWNSTLFDCAEQDQILTGCSVLIEAHDIKPTLLETVLFPWLLSFKMIPWSDTRSIGKAFSKALSG